MLDGFDQSRAIERDIQRGNSSEAAWRTEDVFMVKTEMSRNEGNGQRER